MNEKYTTPTKNEIVVYQPDETIRLDVRLENETVWLTQNQLCELFGVVKSNISYHLKNIFDTGELAYGATVQKIRTVQEEGDRQVLRNLEYFNLDVIISVGYRVNSRRGILFRQWATRVLKEFMLRGYAVQERINLLEDKIDRKFAKTDADVAALKDKVDFFVKTQTPPLQGVFYNGQLWDARAFADKLIGSAGKSIWLIDNWATVETLDMLAKKRNGVAVTVVTSEHRDRKGNSRPKISPADVVKFNAQYPMLTLRFSENFHDRFLIIDDKELYLIGASLKDLGRKCFGFTKMDAAEIPHLKDRA
ncbi:MAG: virulence RhuM family protein [Fibrobacter sp.]|nr:virulence RhuM family protein [Fibrobacter sp.]